MSEHQPTEPTDEEILRWWREQAVNREPDPYGETRVYVSQEVIAAARYWRKVGLELGRELEHAEWMERGKQEAEEAYKLIDARLRGQGAQP